MNKFLSFIYQLPQNLLGFLINIILYKKYEILTVDEAIDKYAENKKIKNIIDESILKSKIRYDKNDFFTSFSLGDYVFIDCIDLFTILHEFGHQKQSKEYRWLYFFKIMIPSFFSVIYDKIFHRKWSDDEINKWYYNLPWEKDANERNNLFYRNGVWGYDH